MICLCVGSFSADGAGEKMVVPAREERVEITLRLKSKPLKTAQLIEELAPNDEDVFVRRSHEKQPRLEREGRANLRSEQVEARIRIGLAGVGEMLVKNAGLHFQAVVHAIFEAAGGENVESKILPLALRNSDPGCRSSRGRRRLKCKTATREFGLTKTWRSPSEMPK